MKLQGLTSADLRALLRAFDDEEIHPLSVEPMIVEYVLRDLMKEIKESGVYAVGRAGMANPLAKKETIDVRIEAGALGVGVRFIGPEGEEP